MNSYETRGPDMGDDFNAEVEAENRRFDAQCAIDPSLANQLRGQRLTAADYQEMLQVQQAAQQQQGVGALFGGIGAGLGGIGADIMYRGVRYPDRQAMYVSDYRAPFTRDTKTRTRRKLRVARARWWRAHEYHVKGPIGLGASLTLWWVLCVA